MKADYRSASKRIANAQGVWLIHGDEPLLAQSLLEQLRQHWQRQGIERQRIDITSASEWREALSQLDNLSLFASQMALEIHTSHKPDNAGLQALERFIQMPGDNLLMIIMPKLDGADQKTKFFQAIAANGLVVALQLQNAEERQSFLTEMAQQLQLSLSAAAWRMLADQTENNLLAAHQALMRLSFLYPSQTEIDVTALQPALTDQSRYTLYDLADAALLGQIERTVRILHYLQESGEAESLILWSLAKEMRLVIQLLEQPFPNYQALGIWSSRQYLYQDVRKRVTRSDTVQWSSLLLRCDQSIKGVGAEQPWDLLLQLCLALAGSPLFAA